MSIRETFKLLEEKSRRRRSGARKRAIGYIRASKEDAELGPEAQESSIRAYAAQHELELVAIYRDIGVSGGSPLDERTGLIEALDAISEHDAEVLIVLRRDRFGRDAGRIAVVERLVERAGAKVLTADGVAVGASPEDRLLRGMLDLLAEYERQLIRARTKAALAAKRRRGEVAGMIPYGFRRDGRRLIEHAEEQAAIREIMRLRDEGFSWKGITSWMQAHHLACARGDRWHANSIQRIHKAEQARRAAA